MQSNFGLNRAIFFHHDMHKTAFFSFKITEYYWQKNKTCEFVRIGFPSFCLNFSEMIYFTIPKNCLLSFIIIITLVRLKLESQRFIIFIDSQRLFNACTCLNTMFHGKETFLKSKVSLQFSNISRQECWNMKSQFVVSQMCPVYIFIAQNNNRRQQQILCSWSLINDIK